MQHRPHGHSHHHHHHQHYHDDGNHHYPHRDCHFKYCVHLNKNVLLEIHLLGKDMEILRIVVTAVVVGRWLLNDMAANYHSQMQLLKTAKCSFFALFAVKNLPHLNMFYFLVMYINGATIGHLH